MLGLRIGGSHNIDAEGTGTVRASVIAEQQENVWRVIYDGGCAVAGLSGPPAGSEGTSIALYAGSAEAGGIFRFDKKMGVSFDVEPGASGDSSILSLCPWSAPAPPLGLTH